MIHQILEIIKEVFIYFGRKCKIILKEKNTQLSINSDWFIKINKCPLCNSLSHDHLGSLQKDVIINRTNISIDLKNYKLIKCNNCNLSYKNYITRPEAELKLQNYWKSNKQEFQRWVPPSIKGLLNLKDYIDKYSHQVFNGVKPNLLDIGIGGGEFIKLFFSDYKTYGVEINPIEGINYDKIINGEILFNNIEDNIDEKYISSFHIITALDIFEHLSRPNDAIKSLHSMLHSNGLLLIETGNISSLPSKMVGYSKWWYTSVLEHKIFWDTRTLPNFLKENGFNILKIQKKKHKGGNSLNLVPIIKYITYHLFPKLYQYIMNYLNKSQNAPNHPRIPWRDHILIIAQK